MICLFFCRFLRFFLLQDLKYVLLRLQKAITKVEQGMKVTFSSYRRFLIDLCDNPGAWHGRIPNRVRRVRPWQAWCWHHRIPGHFSHFRVKSFPQLQIISELPITNNGGGKPWNLSDSGAICHRLACNRKNRWDQHILILGLKESGILDIQERLRLKRLGKSWGSKLSRWCISWSSKNGRLDSYMLSRKSMLWLLKNTIWDPIKTFGRPVQILANILGK